MAQEIDPYARRVCFDPETNLFYVYPFIQPEDDEETKMLKLGQQLLIDTQLEK